MKKRMISLVAIMASLTAICVASSKVETVSANTDDKVVTILPRTGQNEGVLRAQKEYRGLNINWKATTSYKDLHVRVIGSVIPDEGKDYVDLSAYTRLEYEVREGSTKEYFAPTYIDSDGTYTIVGTGDGNATTGGTKIDCNGKLTYPNNQGNSYDNVRANYSGSPVWMANGKDDFAFYHFNINNVGVKTYSDWSAGLDLPNRNDQADKSKVKCFAINLYKSEINRNYDWDFDVLKVYGRDDSGNRKLIFDASKAVMTNSMNDVWNNMKDENGNSYVYYYANNLGSHASDFKASIAQKTKLTSNETQTSNKWTLTKSNGGFLWGWSKLAEAERGAVVDCTGYDAAVFEVNNTTGQDLCLKPRYSYVDGNGATQNHEPAQYTLVGEDGSVRITSNYYIPKDFKGKAYTFFSLFPEDFKTNLSKVKNDFRMVVEITDSNNGKSFELSNYRFTKTGLEQYKQDIYNSLDAQRAKYEDSNYTANGVAALNQIVVNTKQEVENCNTFDNVRNIYNANVESLDEVETKDIEIRKNAIKELESYVDINDYYEAEQNEVKNILNSAKQSINSTNDETVISTIVNNTKVQLDGIETKAEKDALLIVEAKIYAKNEINNYLIDLDAYRDAQKQEINLIKTNAASRIDNCSSLDELSSLITQIKNELDEIKTDAELTKEELDLAKLTAIEEINNYVDLNNYYEEEKNLINNIISETEKSINNSTIISDINPIIKNAKSLIDAIKTKDIIYLENLNQKKIDAKEEINSYKGTEEYFESENTIVESLKNEAKLSIESSDSIEKINALLSKFKAEIDLIPTKKQVQEIFLEDNKEKALLDLNNYLNKENYYDEQVSEINSILNSATNLINSSSTYNDLEVNINELKSILDSVKTKTKVDQERYQNELLKIIERSNNYINSIDTSKLTQKQIEDINTLKEFYINKLNISNDLETANELQKELFERINEIVTFEKTTIEPTKLSTTLIIVFASLACISLIGAAIVIILFRKKKAK